MKVQIFEKKYRLYLSRSTPGAVTLDGVQRLRNKEIHAADNTIVGLQPLNTHLTALAVLAGSAVEAGDVGILRMVAPGVFALDDAAYSTVALSSSAPAALGAAASPGVSDAAARSDHVHEFPSAAQVGAEPAITKSLGALVWNGSTWVFDNTAYIPASAVGSAVQAYDADLAAIAALAGNGGLLRKTAANTWSLDTTSYSTLAVGSTVGAALAASGAAGSASTAARADHVHPLPSAANVGAEPAISKSVGLARWTGSAWAFDNSAYVASGGALGTPSSGNLVNTTVDGTNPPGPRNIPLVSAAANTTLTKAHAGGGLKHPASDTAARTYTVDSHATQNWADGTTLSIWNVWGTGGVITISAVNTMRNALDGSTGSRTLARGGMALLVWDIDTQSWGISGVGLS